MPSGPGHEGAVGGTSSDEEQTLRDFGIHQALPVDDLEPNWDLQEPDSVEEYLRRVRCVVEM